MFGNIVLECVNASLARAQFAFLNKHLGVAGVGEMGVFECLPFFRCWKGKRKSKCHDPWCQC